MSGDVIVTVTLNAALHVGYTTGDLAAEGINAVSRPSYRAGGRGVTVARVLRAFGHDVLAAGLAGGASGELIREDLAKSGVPTAFTLIRADSRRFFRFAGPDPAGDVSRFAEPGPYITTEELGRFAADYRRLMAGAAAVVLCGSLPDGLPADTYGSLVTYAAEAGVPVILDAGGEELKHAISHGPDLVVAEMNAAEPRTEALAVDLIRLGAGAAAVAVGGLIRAVTSSGDWTARIEAADVTAITGVTGVIGANPAYPPARGALVAGLVPGQLLGWSWPDRLRHALALAAGGAGAWTRAPDGPEDRDHVDLAAYERLLDAVRVEPSVR
jgi:tagatose 6-phosphate kinase